VLGRVQRWVLAILPMLATLRVGPCGCGPAARAGPALRAGHALIQVGAEEWPFRLTKEWLSLQGLPYASEQILWQPPINRRFTIGR
jgi:hypothetical protein